MGIQSTTARDAELARKREAFLAEHRLKDYKLSGRHLMKMVLSTAPDKAAADAIRARFTYSYGCSLKWSGPTWDHLEMLGRDGRLMILVSHPYAEPKAECPDLELFRSGGLNVVLGDQAESWYGYGSYHVRVEHPAFSGKVADRPAHVPARPAPSPGRFPGESPYGARLRRAGPALLALALERAEQLAEAIAMIPCVGPRGVGLCVSCELRAELDRITAVIHEVEGIGGPRR